MGEKQTPVANSFSVGEFSKICGVKSDTLRYYDSIDLLKPIRVGENGYRVYSVGQLFNFELIGILKSFNMPLDEIKALFQEESIAELGQLLQDKEARLDEEISRLLRMKHLIGRLSSLSDRYNSVPCGTPFMERRSSERLILSEKRTQAGGELIPVMTAHFKRCREINYGIKYPLGGILNPARLLAGDFIYPDCYFTVAADDVPRELTFEKPDGFYAVIFHRGFYNTLGDSCQALLDFVDAMGWKIIGNLYENDLISNFKARSRAEFVMEISVQIGKDC